MRWMTNYVEIPIQLSISVRMFSIIHMTVKTAFN